VKRHGTAAFSGIGLALLLPLGLAGVLVGACVEGVGDGRFPVCKTNDDCLARDGGAEMGICFDLRCVGCRYDTDCKPGSYCDKDLVCKSLVTENRDEADPTAWDPKNVDECLSACKDKECVDTCSARFPETKKKRGTR